MSDLTDDLRRLGRVRPVATRDIYTEAADEIERLQEEKDALRSKLIDQLRSAADELTIRAEKAYALGDWGLADSLGERANGYRRAAEFIESSTD